MIQSRAQFGFYGAIIPLLLVVLMYVGFLRRQRRARRLGPGELVAHRHDPGDDHRRGAVHDPAAHYSRYLPRDTPVRSTFWWTYGGTVIGTIWMMVFGAIAATSSFLAGFQNFILFLAYFMIPWTAINLTEIPFMSTTFYTGPVVRHLGGADISWIFGLIVAAGPYYALMRGEVPAASRTR